MIWGWYCFEKVIGNWWSRNVVNTRLEVDKVSNVLRRGYRKKVLGMIDMKTPPSWFQFFLAYTENGPYGLFLPFNPIAML